MMRRTNVFITLIFSLTCHAQFYPAATANWCIFEGGYPLAPNNSPNRHLTLVEGADTLISGHSYQRILEYSFSDYNDPPVPWFYTTTYYIRSEPSGMGYLYLPDSAAEYLTGDLSAIAGDTVHDVLVKYLDVNCAEAEFQLTDAIVDSIVTRTYGGVTVQRHYVHTPCFSSTNGNFIPDWSFWQAGYGASNGPYLRYSDLLAPIGPACVLADGDFVYSVWSEPQGMPGTPCNCPDLILGIAETGYGMPVHVTPNPSTGQFTLSTSQTANSVTVYSPTGQQLFQTNGQTMDLSAYPPGLYHAVVRTAQGDGHLSLMVQR